MKILKFPILLAGALTLIFSVNSCNEDSKEYLQFFNVPTDISYTSDGYWSECYNTDYNATGLDLSPLNFSHKAEITVWDGVTYKSWMGFCPSKVHDRTDHSDGNWIDYQWATIASGYSSEPFMLGFWNVQENFETPLSSKSCVIKFIDNSVFYPQTIFISNSAYGYYAMKNGTAYSKAFGEKDYTFVRIYGMEQNVQKGYVDVYLAKDGKILDTWAGYDLSSFGSVDCLVFTMDSSDKGAYGMNNPAYFCMSGFSYLLQKQ